MTVYTREPFHTPGPGAESVRSLFYALADVGNFGLLVVI